MKPSIPFSIVVCALALSLPVAAQYQWIDKDGRRVFSDLAPPADVPASKIVSRPQAAVRAAPAPAAPASAPALAATSSKATNAPAIGVDKALEEKKKQAEAAEAARLKAEEARQAAARADNCQRARSAKTALESGARMGRTDAKGERHILDDAERAAELRRVNEIIGTNCK